MSAPPPRVALLVDDDAGFLTLMKEAFRAWAPGALEVRSASRVGPAMMQINQGDVDVVVLDLRMPVVDGLQFLRLLHQQRPALPKAVLSGLVTEERRRECIAAGAHLVLEKPQFREDFESVCAAIAALAERPRGAGFAGMLRGVTLPELIQLECLSGKTSRLALRRGAATGEILFEAGRIVHAQSGPLTGEEALYALLTWTGGEFDFQAAGDSPRRTITLGWEQLLIEAAKRADEALASGPAPPAPPAITRDAEMRRTRRIVASALRSLPLVEPDLPPSPAAATARREWTVCDLRGDFLAGGGEPDADLRGIFLDFLAVKTAALERALPGLGRGVHLEVAGASNFALVRPASPEAPGFFLAAPRSEADFAALRDEARRRLLE